MVILFTLRKLLNFLMAKASKEKLTDLQRGDFWRKKQVYYVSHSYEYGHRTVVFNDGSVWHHDGKEEREVLGELRC